VLRREAAKVQAVAGTLKLGANTSTTTMSSETYYQNNLRFGGPTDAQTVSSLTTSGRVGVGTGLVTDNETVKSWLHINDRNNSGSMIKLTSNTNTNGYDIGTNGTGNFFSIKDNTSGIHRVTILPNGNVGINVQTPDTPLDISGNTRTSGQFQSTVTTGTAPLTVASTTNVPNLNADLLDGQHGAYYLPLANVSGTANTVAKFTGANTLGDSTITDNGNVGIGSTTPGNKLDVGSATTHIVRSYGGYTGNAAANIGGTGAAAYFPSGIYENGSNSWLYGTLTTNGTLQDNASRWSINPAGNVYFNPAGNIGVGTTTPAEKFSVNGNAIVNGSMVVGNGGLDGTLRVYRNSGAGGRNTLVLTNGTPVAGGITKSSVIQFKDNNNTQQIEMGNDRYVNGTNDFYIYDSTVEADRFYISSAGNAGIGTTTAPYKLEVAGDIRANGGWLRTAGNTGWYNDSYGGGWYMTDANYVQAYNGKSVKTSANMYASNFLASGGCGDMSGGGGETYYCKGAIDLAGNDILYIGNAYGANLHVYSGMYGGGVNSADEALMARVGDANSHDWDYALEVGGRGRFTTTATKPCCGGGTSTLNLAENTAEYPASRASISFHNAGLHEGAIELAADSPRRLMFFDHQNSGLGLELNNGGATNTNGAPLVFKGAYRTYPCATCNDIWMNGMSMGTGDGASKTVHNVTVQTWWGIGFHPSYNNNIGNRASIWMDIRTGTIWAKAGINSNQGDLAEWLNKEPNEKLTPGDVVSISSSADKVTMAKKPYVISLIGIVTTKPGLVMGGDNSYEKNPAKIQVGMLGRLPVKVISDTANIPPGTPVTVSDIAGFATQAVKAGTIVAKTLQSTNHWNVRNCPAVSSVDTIVWPKDEPEDKTQMVTNPDGTVTPYTPGNGYSQENASKPCFRLPDGRYVGKLMAYANVTYYDPDIALTSTGDLKMDVNVAGYPIKNAATGLVIERIGAFAHLVVSHIQVGLLEVQKLMVNGVDVLQKLNEVEKQLKNTQTTVDAQNKKIMELEQLIIKLQQK